MSTIVTYEQLALGWDPVNKRDRKFHVFVVGFLFAMLLLGAILSSIDLPEPERQVRVEIPERIAQFILEKPKPKPKPKAEVKPKVKPKPKIQKKVVTRKARDKQKPLTKAEKKARQKVKSKGLLALGNELSDLIDTSDASVMARGNLSRSAKASAIGRELGKGDLVASAATGSGGVNAKKYSKPISQTKLSTRELTQVKQSLLSDDELAKAGDSETKARSEESIVRVFDQNKSKLYSLYNRERRKTPGLRGTIVFEITIEPDGRVSSINIVSSEINSPNLEKQLISRIRLFNFGAQDVGVISIKYPIAFLSS